MSRRNIVKTDQGTIQITLPGDEEDLVEIQKGVLYLLGNQNEDSAPTSGQLYAISRLLTALLPNHEQLKRGIAV